MISLGPVPSALASTSVGQHVNVRAARRWDRVLQDPRAFTPTEFRNTVTVAENEQRNQLFGTNAANYFAMECDRTVAEHGLTDCQGKTFVHVGGGKLHDLGYASMLHKQEIYLEVVDHSAQACKNVEGFAASFSDVDYRPTATEADIDWWLSQDEFDDQWVLAIFASRVLQFLKPAKLRRVLKKMGVLLRHPGRKLCFVHPFPTDNPHIVWGSTVPHSWEAILNPISQGAGTRVLIVRTAQWMYYNQVYTAFTVVSPRSYIRLLPAAGSFPPGDDRFSSPAFYFYI